MKQKITGFAYKLTIIVLLGAFLYESGLFGVVNHKIEQDARSSQQINADWQVSSEKVNAVVAMLFYDDIYRSHVYSLYVQKNALFGTYLFKAGGQSPFIADSVLQIETEDQVIYLSMNYLRIKRLGIDYGQTVQEQNIDQFRPFVWIAPANSIVSFYDENNRIINVVPEKIRIE